MSFFFGKFDNMYRKLKIFDSDYKIQHSDKVYKQKIRQALWLPFVHQMGKRLRVFFGRPNVDDVFKIQISK